MTEQATSYEIGEAECRTLARRGPVYNPYRDKSFNQQTTLVVAAPTMSGQSSVVGIHETGDKSMQARYGEFRSEEKGPESYN
jgi:hypothetical protein